MHRRRYLAVITTAALAGCSSQSGEGATETATATQSPTETPTQTSTATATSTATETATETPTETATPEATPTAFEAAVADVEAALEAMYGAYVDQGDDAERLPDVDASVEEFDDSAVYSLSNDVDEAINEANDAASDEQDATVDSLQAIRDFLYQAALTQAKLSSGHVQIEAIWTATEDENQSDITQAYNRATINDYRAARSALRDTEDAGSPSDADAVGFMAADEWERKLEQFDAEVSTLGGLGTALEELPDAIQDLVGAKAAQDSQTASESAAGAVAHFDVVLDELDSMLREGVADSFERLLEDLEATCQEKRRDALAIESG